jgi:oligopeptide transport system substrate-binding protein
MRGRVIIAILTVLLVTSCQANSPSAQQLAAEQTLRLPIYTEPQPGGLSLDPATLSFSVETAVGSNLFNGLYRIDEQMQEVPDIARDFPSVSADGLTYTFHLRDDVRFSNGDDVTAADVIYSWNRAVAKQGDWAAIFKPIVGYDAVASGKAGAKLALSAPDPYTLVATLAEPSGYWLAELTLPASWVVNQRAIIEGAEDRWWMAPQDLIGTGPFRLTNWIPGVELDFAPVDHWWGGSTGALKRVELHVTTRADVWAGYQHGRFDMVGYGLPSNGVTDKAHIDAIRADPQQRNEVHTWPFGATSWVAFNLQTGPFSGNGTGMQLRQAFSQAIDRTKLASAVCDGGTICVPATGGLISKGLKGYLGDGADPGAQFKPAAARAAVERLDPNGSLLRGLVFYFPIQAFDLTQALADNLTAQWRDNLGIDVAAAGLDRDTFFTEQAYGKFTISRLGWQADYDHPQDWFDDLLIDSSWCGQPNCNNAGTVYSRPGYSALLEAADRMPLSDALPAYRQAGKMLIEDSAIAVLYYMVRTVVIKPYVQGYGANLLWENRWTSMSILQH